jgi:acyl-CoA dehydrogenase
MAPLERRLRQAQKEGLIQSECLGLQIDEAARAQVINRKEADALRDFDNKVLALLAVDDFAPEDLIRTKVQSAAKPVSKPAAKPAAKSAAKSAKKAAKKTAKPRKKVVRKKKSSKA